jgi:hypothetical protein
MPEQYRYSLPVKAGDQRQLGELTGAACATLVAEMAERHGGPVVLVAPDMQNALRLNDEIRQFTDSMVGPGGLGNAPLRQLLAASGHHLPVSPPFTSYPPCSAAC